METFAIRLHPGQDLKREMDSLALREQWSAACILTGIGSLSEATIRFADQTQAEVLNGPLEIVSLGGTLSPDGSHFHIAVSDSTGVTSAGHLTEGSLIYTTAEIIFGILPEWNFSRNPDPATGFSELNIARKNSTDLE